MSKQGNIVVLDQHGLGIIFTTGRWGGSDTAKLSQNTLAEAILHSPNDPPYQHAAVTSALSHAPEIDRPTTGIGNCDTPTVIIDFSIRKVSWVWTHSGKQIGLWSFEEYLALTLDVNNCDPLVYEAFYD